jgi:hypothetical protein
MWKWRKASQRAKTKLDQLRRTSQNDGEHKASVVYNCKLARRSWIATVHPTITAILKRYPRLQDMNQAVSISSITIIGKVRLTELFYIVWSTLNLISSIMWQYRLENKQASSRLKNKPFTCDRTKTTRISGQWHSCINQYHRKLVEQIVWSFVSRV